MSTLLHRKPTPAKTLLVSFAMASRMPTAIIAVLSLALALAINRGFFQFRDEIRGQTSDLPASKALGLEMVGERYLSFRPTLPADVSHVIRDVDHSDSGTDFTLVIALPQESEDGASQSKQARELKVRFHSNDSTLDPQHMDFGKLASEVLTIQTARERTRNGR